jgi:phosphoribosylanthranilate isomerase
MWIKICGITNLADAETAIAAGADALGFVFAASPRRVTIETARAVIEKLPSSIEKIGVFVDASHQELTETAAAAGLTGVQLHGSTHPAHDQFPAHLRVIHVIRHAGDAAQFSNTLAAIAPANQPATILVDTFVPGQQGGSGKTFDWAATRAGFAGHAHIRFIAAGGLRPENVAEAVRILQPWGVDVSSGVEARPGRKDAARVADFIREARRAGKANLPG